VDQSEIMRRVIELSRQAVIGRHGGPFGAVVVKDGKIIAEAHNEVLSATDPTAHAELLAVRRACKALSRFELSGSILYTNGSPCCMCMSSMLWARLDRIYYILGMDESAAIGLGDADFYGDLAKPEDQRRIVPLSQLPALTDEARAVYHLWRDDPARMAF